MTIHDEYLFYQEKYTKKYGKNTLVLMQVGSFHEAYSTETRGQNLSKISELLNVVLTRKDKSINKIDEKNPYMLGFPSVTLNKFLRTLINNNYTIVVIDQVTSPPNPRREITGIYSPGTYIEESFSPDSNNILSVYIEDEIQKDGFVCNCVGITVMDLSTGESTVHEMYGTKDDEMYALDEVVRFLNTYAPKEIIILRKDIGKNNELIKTMKKDEILAYLELESKNYQYTERINKYYHRLSYQNEFFGKVYPDTGMLSTFEYIDMEMLSYARISFIAALDFAYQHNENIIKNIYKPTIFQNKIHLILGNDAIHQLNVFSDQNSTGDCGLSRFNSLFDVINKTSTAMGRRYLRSMLNNPTVSPEKIKESYDFIEEALNNDFYIKLEDSLKGILDLERMHRKLSLEKLHPYEFVGMYESYCEIQSILKLIKKTTHLVKLVPDPKIMKLLDQFGYTIEHTYDFTEMKKHNLNDIQASFYKKDIHKDIDELQDKITDGIEFMENICDVLSNYIEDKGKAKAKATAKEASSKIQIKKNDRDGYYLSLTKLRAASLRKNIAKLENIQITKNFMLYPKDLRFEELAKGNTKIFFDKLTNKSDDIVVLKEKLMLKVKNRYTEDQSRYHKEYGNMFKHIVQFISKIDFIKSGTKVSRLYNYVRPEIVAKNIKGDEMDNGFIRAKNLRHPIVERLREDVEYVPHDIQLGKDDKYKEGDDVLEGMLLFGINSCGKSTSMKAIGLSIILAQAGLFVPAESYRFSPYNSLFARITGNDNIFKGLSSFVLEMTELKAILKRTGPKTLVIGDEVCRGTEHISGNAIVASTIINLAKTGSSFIFATHLHEIAKMERINSLKNVKPFHLTVDYDKENDVLIFDRKLKPGPGDTIYGITVAKYIIQDNDFINLAQEIKNELSGIPKNILNDKQSKYNSNVYMHKCDSCGKPFSDTQIGYFDTHHINFQKDCKDGFVKSKPHVPMNSKANLVVLCRDCHVCTHQDKLEIKGYQETSRGRKLKIKTKQKRNIELIDDLSDDFQKLESKNKKRKYDEPTIEKVLLLKNKMTNRRAKSVLQETYNLRMSPETIKRIWNGTY